MGCNNVRSRVWGVIKQGHVGECNHARSSVLGVIMQGHVCGV